MSVRHGDGVLRNELRSDIAEDEGAARQGREDRRHVGIGDEKAVDEADGQDARKRDRQRSALGPAVIEHLQVPGRRHRHDRDGREVDAAADHDDRHADRQKTENRDAADDRDQIVDGEEARQADRGRGEEKHGEAEDDPLLRPDSARRDPLP